MADAAPRPVSPLQQALEQALVANPDDIAAHSAYADFLTEQGDPRGEFIQVQLGLEDSKLAAAERTKLRDRETALLNQHARQWLGDAGRFLVGSWSGPDKPWHFTFVRGWLDSVRMLPAPDAAIAALARSPEARLLRRLDVVYDMRYHPFDFHPFLEGPIAALRAGEQANEIYEEATVFPPLVASPYLSNLRAFKMGFSDSGEQIGHSTMVAPFLDCTADQVIELLKKCARIEELYLNTNLPGIDRLFGLSTLGRLRVLQYYFGSQYAAEDEVPAYPLTVLAQNKSLLALTHLRLHAGREATIELREFEAVLQSKHLPSLVHLQVHMTTFGDDGARAIVRSGILHRLRELDIGYGTLTDAGARLLAEAIARERTAKQLPLEVIDVTRNGLSAAGIAALSATGVRVVAENQHGGEEDFLFEVDLE